LDYIKLLYEQHLRPKQCPVIRAKYWKIMSLNVVRHEVDGCTEGKAPAQHGLKPKNLYLEDADRPASSLADALLDELAVERVQCRIIENPILQLALNVRYANLQSDIVRTIPPE
jgi:hypothetical protein